jgi:hypothetical protein
MTKTIKKKDFPSKICVVCNRKFTWRKKWRLEWTKVKTCSNKCKIENRRPLITKRQTIF